MRSNLSAVDKETKDEELEEEEVVFNKSSMSSSASALGQEKPSRQRVLNLLYPLHQEELIELLVPLVLNNSSLYSELLRRAGTNESFRKVFVHGLPIDTNEDELKALFEIFGKIDTFKIVRDRSVNPPKNKGYAFVVYNTVEGAQQALTEPNKWFGGKEICCKLAARAPVIDETSYQASSAQSFQNRKLFVSGLAQDLKETEFYEYFAAFGLVESVQLAVDANGEGKGYGFVTYIHASAAKYALLKSNKKIWRGKQLIVAWCRKREEEENRLRKSHSLASAFANWSYQPSYQTGAYMQPESSWSTFTYIPPPQFVYVTPHVSSVNVRGNYQLESQEESD